MPIVVGAGTAPLAQHALQWAVSEAKLRDLPIVLVAQVPVPRNEPETAVFRRQRHRVEEMVQKKAETLAADSGVRCTGYSPPIPSSPGDAILRAASEFDAELIVIGIRRRSPVGKVVLGSDSQKILLGADCAVIGVKLPDEGRPRSG